MDDIIAGLDHIERALKAQQGYLDTRQAAELTRISTVTLECWRRDGAEDLHT